MVREFGGWTRPEYLVMAGPTCRDTRLVLTQNPSHHPARWGDPRPVLVPGKPHSEATSQPELITLGHSVCAIMPHVS